MSVVLTIRGVPEESRDALMREAREQGKSLQAYLLAVIEQQVKFIGNRQILADIEAELAEGGGAGPDAPDAADLIRASRPDEDMGFSNGGFQEKGGAA
ncbi:hypothetical protein HNR23_002551 [Nocardiopsis mwathae]|uniref:Antitoxin FitA-like ribbon-helix-helix domain-containing protein n=1 Tax=Nocardiopsis mwathae TaxID=1472723 RepID=A0A7X0D692_9ACTN|nr:hypothetical protein [Nocardiopsis mwathae]MBB6172491.1 hypothetical protein [Nocardiopsis mwathae]